MTKDIDKSIGDQSTLRGGKSIEPSDRSLGDRSTFIGDSPSSVADLSDLGSDADQGIEIVDLAARYKIERVLGKGGMGEVLLATDTRLNRKVAIKRILGSAARSKTAVARFLTEAQSIAALNHPNIVQIYDYGRAKDGPFLIMEYVDGSSLLERCRDGAIPLEDAVDLACQLLDGLGRAHDAGIIHRDIKPANILLSKDGIPKLTDFGLAKAESADTGMTMAGAVLGTLDFMPPEQRKDATLSDARSDLWSLAATLYQMVTGEPPRVIDLDAVPQQLRGVFSQALKAKKEDRYQSAKEFKQVLKQNLTAGAEVELELGACPHCGTKNDTNRKFCKKCAQSLEVACLGCQSKLPMWEEVCGQCGAKQSELIEKRKQAMAGQREKAEQFLEQLEFKQAVSLAKELGSEPDLRLQHLKFWSQKFVEQAEKSQQEQLARLANLVGEAIKHEQAYDYSSAIHTLEQVPEALHHECITELNGMSAATLLSRNQTKQQEVERLLGLIRHRVSTRQLVDLRSEVEKFLELNPSHTAMLKLRQQLEDREAKLLATRDEAYAAAQKRMAKLDYEGAVHELERIDASVMQPHITALKEEASYAASRLQTLQKSISVSLQEKRYHGLLSQVTELLQLKPNDAAMQTLQGKLVEREEKNASQIREVVTRAQELLSHCRFVQARNELARIPEELQTQEVLELIADCESMESLRQSAMMSLANGLKTQDYSSAIGGSQQYRDSILARAWEDLDLQPPLRACQKGLSDQQAEAVAAEKRRKTKRLLMLIYTAVLAVLIAGGALWIRSSMRANAIANAVQQQSWDEALALDPDNVDVFIGRAEQELNKDVWDEAKVAADLDRVVAISPNHPRLMSLKTLAAEKAKSEGDRIVAEKTKAEAEAKAILAERPIVNSINLALKKLPGGTFTMGEGTEAHRVTLTRPVYIGVYEVTQEQYERVMDINPGRFKGAQNPVDLVSWENAVEFCRRLSELPEEKAAGRVYRLPTEAEWEYACRAGTTTKYSFGDDENQLENYAWYSRNSNSTNHPVGQKQPNAWGLYDMHGNVWEWCWDRYGDYPKGAVTDPMGPSTGSGCVHRGGSLGMAAAFCRSAFRGGLDPSHRSNGIGFRVALSFQDDSNKAASGSVTRAPIPDNLPRPGFGVPPGDSGPKAEGDRIVAEKVKAEADRIAAEAKAKAILAERPIVNSIKLELKQLPGGIFTMGDSSETHEVTLTKPFYIGVYEVTQEQYQKVIGVDPSSFNGASNPVEQVSWADAVNFCRLLSALPEEQAAGRVYRLPTEAEWEYACRAGTSATFSFGDNKNQLSLFGWHYSNSYGTTHPVGQKQPNAWGLYDMHGNVWEWCSDWHGDYPKGAVADPMGPAAGTHRVIRGGCWSGSAADCRSALRFSRSPSDRRYSYGFRVALSSQSGIPK